MTKFVMGKSLLLKLLLFWRPGYISEKEGEEEEKRRRREREEGGREGWRKREREREKGGREGERDMNPRPLQINYVLCICI